MRKLFPMNKKSVSISNPDELNKHLQSSSVSTWIALGAVISLLVAFFVWSFIYKLPVKLSGIASVISGQASLKVDEKVLDKVEVGQKVYISNQEGVITFDSENKPVVLNLDLKDGEYTYRTDIVIKEIRPIDFLIK